VWGKALITVIIGTENNGRILVPTLAALVPGAAAGAIREVIVADGGSTDATAEVAEIAGCEFLASKDAPLAQRLRDAAQRARAAWLMFLRPGVLLDSTWIEEAHRFIEHAERSGQSDVRAAVFRQAPSIADTRPLLFEALVMLKSALSRRPHPEQGLLISKRFYEQLGSHRVGVVNPETDLLRRLGRKRTIMLRSAAVKVTDN
jgi:glycosyltransferase involved in cell wall biosynthesis